MGHRVGLHAARDHRTHRGYIDAGGYKQPVAERDGVARQRRVERKRCLLEQHPPRKRVAVAVKPRRGEGDNDISLRDRGWVDALLGRHGTHREACEVILAIRVHARHLRGLSPGQPAARLPATFGNACYDGRADLGPETTGREVVEKEERPRACDEDVVHTHRDAVDADGVVAIGGEGDLQLGADAVGARNKARAAWGVTGLGEIKDGAESAEPAYGARNPGRGRERANLTNHLVARVDVHAGCCVVVTLDCHRRLRRRFGLPLSAPS